MTLALKNLRTTIKELHSGDILDFGQYVGSCIDTLIKCNPEYVKWLSNKQIITLDKQLKTALNDNICIDAYNRYKACSHRTHREYSYVDDDQCDGLTAFDIGADF